MPWLLTAPKPLPSAGRGWGRVAGLSAEVLRQGRAEMALPNNLRIMLSELRLWGCACTSTKHLSPPSLLHNCAPPPALIPATTAAGDARAHGHAGRGSGQQDLPARFAAFVVGSMASGAHGDPRVARAAKELWRDIVQVGARARVRVCGRPLPLARLQP